MTEPPQRRRERASLFLKVRYPDADAFLHDYSENISKGGMFIHTERDLAPGARLKVELSFPALLHPIGIDAVVRWKRDDPRGDGVEFTADDAPALRRIEELVDAVRRDDPSVVSRRVRILVVEDNPLIQNMLEEGLTAVSKRRLRDAVQFDFARASDGHEAIGKLSIERYDLVIADLFMPVLDGTQLIQLIRRNHTPRALPILAVSSGGEEAGRNALAAGADMFIPKPLRLDAVFDTIRSLLKI